MVSSAVLSKNFNQFSKILYHGTTSKHFDSLQEGVNIDLCQEYTDFGKGFYLTSNFIQASKHAEKRAKLEGEEPIVFIYVLDISRLKKEYNGYILHKMDLEWAKFIYNNRSKKQCFTHRYDYVFGGVADGKIFDLVNLVDSGELDIELFYEEIAQYATYDQLSIHNQNIFTYNVITLQKVVKAYDQQQTYNDKRTVKK